MENPNSDYDMTKAVEKITNARIRWALKEKALDMLPDGSLVMGVLPAVKCQHCGTMRWDDGTKCTGIIKVESARNYGRPSNMVCGSYYNRDSRWVRHAEDEGVD